MKHITPVLAAVAVFSSATAFAQTTVQLYRGGEDDGPAGATVNAGTGGSTYDLTLTGSGFSYTSSTSGYAGSSLALSLSGNTYFSGTANTALSTANFIMELYVNPSSTGGLRNLLLVGSANASLAGNGVAITQYGTQFGVVRPGVIAVQGFGTVSTGTWTHVALVFSASDGGTLDFYIDGVHAGQTGTNGFNTISGETRLGGAIDTSFDGIIDHARISTFTGSFNTSMLAISAIPEPSTVAGIVGAIALALAGWFRLRGQRFQD